MAGEVKECEGRRQALDCVEAFLDERLQLTLLEAQTIIFHNPVSECLHHPQYPVIDIIFAWPAASCSRAYLADRQDSQKQVPLKEHPELVLLLKPGEDLATLLKLPKEELLVRWVNLHMVNAGSDKMLSDFSSDMKHLTTYTRGKSIDCWSTARH
ncbi:hypothetical protein GUITHDRAFT_146564 [Guillardia theta CCMP2712]|uniref:Uncharacterized protein n=1 Tax=Guillardia theta (strain CCMP2712) TaxID=905079 RepID=L1IHH5_GUITC|nr:hypothetical protein GUITHDRAFT_146564 [Guillardia theta CCMP2712]EKX35364.1 hypothetical protein GUITHDRAFT_146564 [Guillardia theta CCMP2712]|eukprot:XP_005822344.1 hypothetical protein GUITHDRAFT_146564 [Guillardia theta CCMP2712]